MTGKGHIISGTAIAVITDRIINLLSDKIEAKYNINIGAKIFDFLYYNYCPDKFVHTKAEPLFLVLSFAIFASFFILGCLLPDTDHPESILGRKFYIPVRHRTWTHTMWIVIIFILIGIFLKPFRPLAYGYFIHLFVDSFSRGGVCFFYPISKYIDYPSGAHVKKKHIFKLYKPGGISEIVVNIILILITVFCILFPMINWNYNPYNL